MGETDAQVIIIGAGPAGTTVATLLADAGHRVMLLDKARFPRHKPCSDYVSPAGEPLLEALGVLGEMRRAGASRMDAMIVHAPNGEHFRADFSAVEPGRAAIGLSRYRLDHILLERAREAGVLIREGAHVRDVLREGGRVVGVEATIDATRERIHAPLVIGADGHSSVLSRGRGLDIPWRWPRKTGLASHFRGVNGLGTAGEMHVGHGVYAGLAVLEHGLTNLTVVVPTEAVRSRDSSLEAYFDHVVASLPGIADKLDGAERVGNIRGVGPMGRRARQVAGDGYLLVGDAAAFLDPFVGEGVYQALRSGFLASAVVSAAVRAGDTSTAALDGYRRARRREFTTKRAVSWIVQGFVNTPPLMNYVTVRLGQRDALGLELSGVLGNLRPATRALSPIFLARLLRP
jgi:menaquinone-9 beta-reductase